MLIVKFVAERNKAGLGNAIMKEVTSSMSFNATNNLN